MKTFRLFTILFAAVFTFLASSCAEKVEVVDNTRDYALPKTMFSGEWFARSMITDVNYISSYAAPGYIGTPSPTERIRWQITKNELIGYRVDEVVPGSNDHPLGRTLDEHKVVSYSISHFDLRNSFNPQTGQENNVISESTTGFEGLLTF